MPRDTDLTHLHPEFRSRLLALLDELRAVAIPAIPLALFEGARTPFRQAELFCVGRTTGERGRTVTRARPWDSFHQYALAADLVFRDGDGQWTWDEPRPGLWADYRARAERHGLRCLSFERPHVELPVPLADLEQGRYPADGGDSTWRDWLEQQVELWGLTPRTVNSLLMPGAPEALLTVGQRPVIDVAV